MIKYVLYLKGTRWFRLWAYRHEETDGLPWYNTSWSCPWKGWIQRRGEDNIFLTHLYCLFFFLNWYTNCNYSNVLLDYALLIADFLIDFTKWHKYFVECLEIISLIEKVISMHQVPVSMCTFDFHYDYILLTHCSSSPTSRPSHY